MPLYTPVLPFNPLVWMQASDIPQDYLTNQVSIFGKVNSIEVIRIQAESVPVLRIHHVPIFQLPFRSTISSNLPVIIAGVNLSKDYTDEAKDIMRISFVDKKVKVRLLRLLDESNFNENHSSAVSLSIRDNSAEANISKTDYAVYGEVRLKRLGRWSDCLASRLLAEGFGVISYNHETLSETYRRGLQGGSAQGRKARKGVWKNTEPDPSLLSRIINRFKFWK